MADNSEERKEHERDWATFWRRSSIRIPDRRLESLYRHWQLLRFLKLSGWH